MRNEETTECLFCGTEIRLNSIACWCCGYHLETGTPIEDMHKQIKKLQSKEESKKNVSVSSLK